jgi:glycosyltransferase involved in cell wall biosynthesis
MLGMNPDYTIITPSYNYGRYLYECLASVAEQEGVTIEHLIFDGGSTDHSSEIAANFCEAKWTQEADSGMSDAINKGFASARGDWVMWLNADDRLKNGALSLMLNHLRKSQADVVYGDWDFIDETGSFLRHVKAPKWSQFVNVYHHCFVGSTAAFYRRSTVIAEGHRLREDFRYVMDGEFYARLASVGKKFEHVKCTVADFRIHGGNLSQRHLHNTDDLETILSAEFQHAESRTIRRAYGITLFRDPYMNGLIDGVFWIVARFVKIFKKFG